MAMGKRRRHAKQTSMWVATHDLPRSAAHPCYTRLNQILDEHDFDGYVQGLCQRFYADEGRPGLPPGPRASRRRRAPTWRGSIGSGTGKARPARTSRAAAVRATLLQAVRDAARAIDVHAANRDDAPRAPAKDVHQVAALPSGTEHHVDDDVGCKRMKIVC
jgi:hypothetical protein